MCQSLLNKMQITLAWPLLAVRIVLTSMSKEGVFLVPFMGVLIAWPLKSNDLELVGWPCLGVSDLLIGALSPFCPEFDPLSCLSAECIMVVRWSFCSELDLFPRIPSVAFGRPFCLSSGEQRGLVAPFNWRLKNFRTGFGLGLCIFPGEFGTSFGDWSGWLLGESSIISTA